MTFLVLVEGAAGCARWPEVDSSHPSEVSGLLWEFETARGPGEACLHQDGTCRSTDVRQEDAVWLVITFHEPDPADLDLVFCDEGFTCDIQLRAGTAGKSRRARRPGAPLWSRRRR